MFAKALVQSGRLRHHADMGHDRDAGRDDRRDPARVRRAFELNRRGPGADEHPRVADCLLVADLIRHERHVDDHVTANGGARDGRPVTGHIVERHVHGRVVTQDHVAQRVTHQDHVDAGGFDGFTKADVVGRDGGERHALPIANLGRARALLHQNRVTMLFTTFGRRRQFPLPA